MKGKDKQVLIIAGAGLLLVFLILNLYWTLDLRRGIGSQAAAAAERARPADIELTLITADCAGRPCYPIEQTLSSVKSGNVNILKETSLDQGSAEAKALMQEYGIKRLPTILVTGETEKVRLQGFEQQGDALVLLPQTPLYLDVSTGNVVGNVRAVLLKDSTCGECYDFTSVIRSLEQGKVVLSEQREVEYSSLEGKGLVAKHKVKKIPALLLSEDIDAYPIAANLRQAGYAMSEGYYVVESLSPPYVNASDGTKRGEVSITLLADKSCGACYDVNTHKQILQRFGMAFSEEKLLDISDPDGKQAVQQYTITSVPTIILTGDVGAYAQLTAAWSQVGTVEGEAYVFRQLAALGSVVYKDLTTGQVVNASRA